MVREGANITLQVETVSFMPECSEVVQWSLGGFEVASGRDLVIESAQVEDGGVYHANFTQMTGDHYQTAVTSVSLTVQGRKGCGQYRKGNDLGSNIESPGRNRSFKLKYLQMRCVGVKLRKRRQVTVLA